MKYIHIMSQGLLSFVEGINLSFISKNQTQFLFFSFQYNDSMLVYYGSTKLNFPVFQTYCLLEMETKKSAIYSKCQTHPKLLLMIRKPFSILPIGTFKLVRRRPSNTSYFLPSKCMGFPNW